MNKFIKLSIVMPCLNEAETIRTCIDKAQIFLTTSKIPGEIVVADNGSDDQSIEFARASGARVVPVSEKGYGSALLGGNVSIRGCRADLP